MPPTTPDPQYDAIVIGAGIAGLIAAATLAQGGLRVCVLEANHQPGGLMAGIWRKGFYFDVGDQSFESGNLLFPLLKNLGVYDDLTFLRAWYRLKTPNVDAQIRTPADLPEAFARAFPSEASATHAFFETLNHELDALLPLLREDHNPLLHQGIGAIVAVTRLAVSLGMNAPRLWRLLHVRGSTRAADYYEAGSAALDFMRRMGYRNMSTFIWLGFMHSWWHDYWYPVGGLEALNHALADRITELGGQIFYKRAVTHVLTASDRRDRHLHVIGVETAKGDRIAAAHVIHTGDMKLLYHYLLPRHRSLEPMRERIVAGSLSEALTSVYLGLRIPPRVIRDCLQTHHTFYFAHYDVHDPHETHGADLHERAWLEISAPGIDAQNEHLAPPGHSSLVVQTMVPASWYNRWQTSGAGDKSAYRALKAQVIQQVLSTLDHLLPGVAEHVVYADVGSALSATRFTHTSGGATAGWTFDPHASPLRNRIISIRTPITGLLTAGHYAIWPGSVPTAALSGRLAADRVLGRPLGALLGMVEGLLPLPALPPADDPGLTDPPTAL